MWATASYHGAGLVVRSYLSSQVTLQFLEVHWRVTKYCALRTLAHRQPQRQDTLQCSRVSYDSTAIAQLGCFSFADRSVMPLFAAEYECRRRSILARSSRSSSRQFEHTGGSRDELTL